MKFYELAPNIPTLTRGPWQKLFQAICRRFLVWYNNRIGSSLLQSKQEYGF